MTLFRSTRAALLAALLAFTTPVQAALRAAVVALLIFATPAQAALAIIQSTGSVHAGNAAGPALGVSPTAGHLIAEIYWDEGGAFVSGTATINGWTRVGFVGSGAQGTALFVRIVAGGDGVTYPAPITSSATQTGTVIWEISGNDPTPANNLDLYDAAIATSGTTATSPAHNTTTTNELALAAGFFDNQVLFPAAATLTAGGYTTDIGFGGGLSTSGVGGHHAYASAGTGTTYTATAASGTPNAAVAAIAILKISAPTSRQMLPLIGCCMAANITSETQGATP